MVADKGNPEYRANFFSQLTFHWVGSIFSTGYKRPLTPDDIFSIDPRLQSERLTALLEQQWFEEAQKKKNPSLLVTLLKRHLFTLIWIFFLANIEAGLRLLVPYFVSEVTAYFDPTSDMTLKTALYWSAGLGLLQLNNVSFRSWMFYRIMRFGTSIRVSVTGLIYRKACRITQSEIGDRSVGLIINLITNDAQRLDEYIVPSYVLLNIWLVIGLGFGMMYLKIGLLATIAGFTSMLLFIPIQFGIGKLILHLRTKIAPLTDRRVKIIHEIVSFMKIIKMYGWELMFQNLVAKVRQKETKLIGTFVLMRAINNALLFISPILSLIVVVIVKRYVDEPLSTSGLFFYLSMANTVKLYINIFLGHTFSFVPQVFHSLRRIENFLNADEITHLKKKAAISNLTNDVIINKNFLHKERAESNGHVEKSGLAPNSSGENAVVIENMSARWSKDSFYLSGLNLSIKRGELIAVVGPVACGKTTFLMSLIQELDRYSGNVQIDGTMSFSSQVPWIYNGSIEENIIFNRPLDKEKLAKCIESCYLTRDLELFPNEIYTIVGERGVQLSGGQRARVNLARAVYGDSPIVLLDDPLSAVDSRCANHIFNKLIKGQLANSTRILVTHATHFLDKVDRIVVMDTDVSEAGGNEQENGGEGCKRGIAARITHVGTYAELIEQGVNLSVFGVSQRKKSRLDSGGGTDTEEEESDEEEEEKVASKPEEVKEEQKTGQVSKLQYLRYLGLGLGYGALPFLLLAIISPQILDVFQQDWLIKWKEYMAENPDEDPATLDPYDTHQFHIYLGLGFGAILLFLNRAFFFVLLCNRSGKNLHGQALFSVLRSPMRYFDTHPIGIIINRFSKDTYYMDERFPDVFLEFVGLLTIYTGTLTLVTIANPWFLLALVPLFILLLLIVRYYLGTSVDIRRIEAIKRSPLLSHLSATLAGLTTIRANNQIDEYESIHYRLRDDHTRCWMVFCAASRWFALRLDILSVVVSVVAVFLCVSIRDIIGASVAGLSLVYVNNMIGGFQWCIRQFTESETMMTAIERIFQFAELPSEAPLQIEGDQKAAFSVDSDGGEVILNKSAESVDLPAGGVIEFRGVSLKYDPEGSYVLHDLTFCTQPAEKIGVVGRTGAGKSTILQALFRMVEPEGDILLDGRLTRDMGLHQLRRSISIIPQESLLFSESLRLNLDPFSLYSEEDIWNVLERVELKAYVAAQTGGLDMMVQEGGGNLSAGQRQLLCLARALLRDNNFLVIDEATANVDEKTDQLIQATLRDKFAHCTVLTIAHRINTIIDSDRIMVMDAGRLVEFDRPDVLLNREGSYFYDLVKETGMFDMLYEQARQSFEKKQSTNS